MHVSKGESDFLERLIKCVQKDFVTEYYKVKNDHNNKELFISYFYHYSYVVFGENS